MVVFLSFQDIVSCANILSQPAASSSTSEAPLPPLDLLVDVLIAYLDKASSDLKSLASLVFGLLSSEVQPSTIEHLIAVSTKLKLLETVNTDFSIFHHLQQLEQNGDGYESDEDVEEEEDVEDDEEAASESEDDGADDEEDDLEVDAEFRRRVADALQVAGAGVSSRGAANGVDDDEDMQEDDGDEDDDVEDDESDKESISMDDDQMLALDDKLASIFKERRTGKKGNSAGELLETEMNDLRMLLLREYHTMLQWKPCTSSSACLTSLKSTCGNNLPTLLSYLSFPSS